MNNEIKQAEAAQETAAEKPTAKQNIFQFIK